jgi:hypothetical protein
MALSDFTFLQSTSGATPTLTSSSPIQGSSSLLVQISINDSPSWILAYTAGLTKECVEARVLLRQNQSNVGAAFNNIGVFAQMQGAIALGSSAYYVGMHFDTFSAPAGTLTISKGPVNSSLTGGGVKANAFVQFPAKNGVVAIGLRCELDATSGNVLLTALYDPGPISIPVLSTYDFPGLAPVASYLDATSPYTTGTFGLAGQLPGGSVIDPFRQTFDVLVVDTD